MTITKCLRLINTKFSNNIIIQSIKMFPRTNIKTEINRLLAANEEKPSSITFNISAKDSSTINVIGTGVLAPTQTH